MQPVLTPSSTLRDAVHEIEAARRGIAVVVDAGGRLIGTVTDGDIRRAILVRHTLESPIGEAMNRTPVTADIGTSEAYLAELLVERGLEAIPLVNAQDNFVQIVHIRDLQPDVARGGGEGFAAAVIMAGGEGKRLHPLTKEWPKPMIEVGGMPMIERLVRALAHAGIGQIYIAVNYLGHVIERHLGDGARFGANITYCVKKRKWGPPGRCRFCRAYLQRPYWSSMETFLPFRITTTFWSSTTNTTPR